MKKLFITAALVAIAGAALAQNTPKNILGIRAGLNFSNIKMEEASYMEMFGGKPQGKAGFHVGISEEFRPFRAPLYIETGFYYMHRGLQCEATVTTPKGVVGKLESTANLSYFQMPLVLNYRIDLGGKFTMSPSLGVYFAYGFTGNVNQTFSNPHTGIYGIDYNPFVTESISYPGYNTPYEMEKQAKNFDMGMRFGLSATYGKFVWGLGYDLGCKDIANYPDDYTDTKYKSYARNLTLTLGYNF